MSDERVLHPETGLHYIHIFPHDKVFQEIEQCYRLAAWRAPWLSVEALSPWWGQHPGWADPRLLLIFWGTLPRLPLGRSARVAHRYTESAGAIAGLVKNQQRIMGDFIQRGQEPDLVLVGSPSIYDLLKPHCRQISLYPIGYDPDIMGVPDWGRSKAFDVGFHGTLVGRREIAIPYLQARLGRRFLKIEDFGRARKEALDGCRVDLHVGHSTEPSFPGMRLWQAAAASAAIVTELRDAWPAQDGLEYMALPSFDQDDPDRFLGALEGALQVPLEEIARRAHGHLEQFRIERCMRDFLVPASAALLDRIQKC